MLLFAVLFLLPGAFAFPAAQNAVSCSRDSLYTSLSRDGGDFCSSMMRTPCEVSSTPTQFTSYSSAKLSSYVMLHLLVMEEAGALEQQELLEVMEVTILLLPLQVIRVIQAPTSATLDLHRQ